jgi:hypothetical protein
MAMQNSRPIRLWDGVKIGCNLRDRQEAMRIVTWSLGDGQ